MSLNLMAVQGCSEGGNMDCSESSFGFSALKQLCEEQQVDAAILCPKAPPSLSASFDETGELQ